MASLISIIVTTYQRPDALDAVLRSLARQQDREFEVLVGDDGSKPPTRDVVERWQGRLGAPLTHVWHEDRGFRLAEIRNRSILASHGEYCIFLDGDCIARPDFVAAHRRLAERGWFVTGNRALLSDALTAAVLRDRLEPEHWPLSAWIGQRLRGDLNRIAPLLTLPIGPLRKLRSSAWRRARGSNLGFWRADLDRVDGFDADYLGWGREDSDLLIRLMRAGIRRKDGGFATGVLHLWHPEADRSALPQNDQRLDALRQGDRIRAERGLSTLRAEMTPAR